LQTLEREKKSSHLCVWWDDVWPSKCKFPVVRAWVFIFRSWRRESLWSMMVGVVVGSCVPLNNTVQSALDAPERDNSSSADDISQGSKRKVVERDVIYLFFSSF
jgi:hypothetical protein